MSVARKTKFRTGEAAAFLGVHHQTVREWERDGLLACDRVGPARQRQFDIRELERYRAVRLGDAGKVRVVVYARVSGTQGQESSLESQVEELVASVDSESEIVMVVREKASGLKENRPKLKQAIGMVAEGNANRLMVTHADRLTRFGFGYLEELVNSYGGEVLVLHDKQETAPEQELIDDFMSLIACFSGRLYGRRSADARKRLLNEAAK